MTSILRALSSAALVATLTAATACESKAPAEMPLFDVFYKELPVYRPSSFGEMRSTDVGAGSGLTHRENTWWCFTSDGKDKVIAFYEKALPPGWTRELDREKEYMEGDHRSDCERRYIFKPRAGADELERVSVDIEKASQVAGKTEFRIVECVPLGQTGG